MIIIIMIKKKEIGYSISICERLKSLNVLQIET